MSDKPSVSVSFAAISAFDVEMLNDKEEDGSSSSLESGYTDDDNKPKNVGEGEGENHQGEVPELAANELEKTEFVNEIASEDLENSLKKRIASQIIRMV